MQRPGLRSDEAREREDYIEAEKFHRAHLTEITYFSILVAAALLIISFFVDPDWAWFLRGGLAGCSSHIYMSGAGWLYIFGAGWRTGHSLDSTGT
jgi:hypothetical protein